MTNVLITLGTAAVFYGLGAELLPTYDGGWLMSFAAGAALSLIQQLDCYVRREKNDNP